MKKFWLVLLVALVLVGCGNKDTKKNEMANTIWIATDGSEMVFEDTEFNWYQVEGEHDDNYFNGTYEYYRGTEAVEFITTELSSYGVTKEELERIFTSSDVYSESNFVVLNFNHKTLTTDGKTDNVINPSMPWYGFILENDTYLDVVNMTTGTYYKFTKK